MGSGSSIFHKDDIDKELINLKIWKLDNTNPIYPEYEEFKEKKDVGLALSGGGMRSAVLSIGWLQALNELGLLTKLKYISSISGGTWTHGPLTYSTIDTNTFLGHSIKPEDCTIKNIKHFTNEAKSHAKTCKEAKFMFELLQEFVENKVNILNHHKPDFWSQTVGESFLDTYGVNCNKSEEELKVHINNYFIKKTIFPYPILNGSVLIGGERGAVPIEFTPYYYGVPISYKENNDIHIRGLLSEPHGFTATIETNEDLHKQHENFIGEHIITVNKPTNVISVHEQSGISSANLAQRFGDDVSSTTYQNLNFPSFDCILGNNIKFIDGGSTDNTGILALLRRKCTHIIACLACNGSVNESGIDSAILTAYGTLAGLFGTHYTKDLVDSVTSEWFNKQRHVFDSKHWNELIDVLKSKLKQGKPLTHKMIMEVLPNPLINVLGGYHVTIVFTFSGECKDFYDKLPQDMKELIEKDKKEGAGFLEKNGITKASTALFPYVPVSALNFSGILVGLISQLAAYSLLQHEDDLKSLFI